MDDLKANTHTHTHNSNRIGLLKVTHEMKSYRVCSKKMKRMECNEYNDCECK